MKDSKLAIEEKRKKILSNLDREIDGCDVVLLDVPNYFNPGDQLIWKGEEQALKDIGIKIAYRSSLHFFNKNEVSDDVCMLLQGGGNFGDLYKKHQIFREEIVKMFPNNKIIILPCTFYFSDKLEIKKNVDVFSKHSNLVIAARDNNTFKELKKYYIKNKVLLMPDMAYAITNLHFRKIKEPRNKILYLSRKDQEKGRNLTTGLVDMLPNIDVLDWPCYDKLYLNAILHLTFLELNRLILLFYRFFGKHWSKNNDIHGLIKFHLGQDQIDDAIDRLLQYNIIITTRLHGFVLCDLLNITTIMVDNAYGKNSQFFSTWFDNEVSNRYFSSSVQGVKKIIDRLI